MKLSDAFRSSYRAYVARPAAVLPLFVLGLGAPIVGQAVALLGVLVAYLLLARSSDLSAFLEALEANLEQRPVSLDDPQSVETAGEAIATAGEALYSPSLQAVLVLTVLGIVVVGLVANAAVGAGQVHAVYAVLSGRPATRSAVDGVFRHWLTFFTLLVVEAVVLVAFLFVYAVAVAAGFAAGGPPGGLLAALVGLPVFLAVYAPLRLLFAFAGPAAVVGNVGFFGALRHSFDYATSNPLQAIGYGLLAVVALAAVGVVTGVLLFVGSPTAGSLLSVLVVAPLLTLAKVGLLASARGERLSVPERGERSTRGRLADGLRSGLGELGAFLGGHPLHVVASLAVLVVGAVVGLRMGTQVDHLFQASIRTRIGELNPAGAVVEYGANNWTVVVSQVAGGFALGVPTVANLLFNGVNLGVLYALESEPQVLLAFVLPHGLFEIPAIVFAGALGLHLGLVSLGYADGRVDRDRLAREVDRAFWVVVGLGVLIAVAAVIEGLFSPYYWRFLGL